MSVDPIVGEVRAIRDKLAAQCGHDVKETFRGIRQRQAESGLEYVRYAPRRVVAREDASGPPGVDDRGQDDHGA